MPARSAAALTALVSAQVRDRRLVRHLGAVDLAFGLGQARGRRARTGQREIRLGAGQSRIRLREAVVDGGRVLGGEHLAGGDGLSRLHVDGGDLARALEIEVRLAVRSEVAGERHRLRHGSQRRDAGPIRDGRRVTARQQEGPCARCDEHNDDADDEWLAEQATSHVERTPKNCCDSDRPALIVAPASFRESDGARTCRRPVLTTPLAARGRSRDRTRDLLGVSEAL